MIGPGSVSFFTFRFLFCPVNISRFYHGMPDRNILCLFDVDGTLTESRKVITPVMKAFILDEVSPKVDVALVGGSDFAKISEQIGGMEALSKFKYVFSENGLVAHNYGKEFKRNTIQEHMGEEKLQKFINFALGYMSKLILPVKRGTFIEFRTGLINVCPVGRSCSQKERDEFEQYDKINKIRETFIKEIKKQFPDLGLVYSIGGQISFDVFPEGWDKTYCLNHIATDDYEEIHFFGDKTDPGGNDHEIYNSSRVKGHKVTSPNDTMAQLKGLLKLNAFILKEAYSEDDTAQPRREVTQAQGTLVREKKFNKSVMLPELLD